MWQPPAVKMQRYSAHTIDVPAQLCCKAIVHQFNAMWCVYASKLCANTKYLTTSWMPAQMPVQVHVFMYVSVFALNRPKQIGT